MRGHTGAVTALTASPRPSATRSVVALVLFIAISFVVAGAGSLATFQNVDGWYADADKAFWTPPNIVFGPVWTVLYLSMAVAAWLVWRRHGWQGARWALSLYGVQLVANALWSWLFFGWRLGYWAFADVVLLWLLIAATVAAFFTRHRGAALLLLPYWAWVSFATALTWTVWRANPALLGT